MSIITIRTQCRGCPRITRTDVDEDKLLEFQHRMDSVQALFPDHDANDREAIMGYRGGHYLCPKCWPDEQPPEDEVEE